MNLLYDEGAKLVAVSRFSVFVKVDVLAWDTTFISFKELQRTFVFIIFPIKYFCGCVPWLYQYWPGGFMVFVILCPGTPEGSTNSGSGFKASQKTGQRLKVSSDRLGEAGNRTCDPWFTRHRFIPYTTAASHLSYQMLSALKALMHIDSIYIYITKWLFTVNCK